MNKSSCNWLETSYYYFLDYFVRRLVLVLTLVGFIDIFMLFNHSW